MRTHLCRPKSSAACALWRSCQRLDGRTAPTPRRRFGVASRLVTTRNERERERERHRFWLDGGSKKYRHCTDTGSKMRIKFDSLNARNPGSKVKLMDRWTVGELCDLSIISPMENAQSHTWKYLSETFTLRESTARLNFDSRGRSIVWQNHKGTRVARSCEIGFYRTTLLRSYLAKWVLFE